MLQQTYNELQKPVTRLMELSEDEIFRLRKDAWDRARQDEEARNHLNRTEGKAEVVLNLRKEGLPVSVIAKATVLSPEEIERLSGQ
jgi:hypothetical protein